MYRRREFMQHLFTTKEVPNGQTIRSFGMVQGSAVQGLDIGKDLALFVRDIVGGRSKVNEAAADKLTTDALEVMWTRARDLGATAVVGVIVDMQPIGTAQMSALVANACGTAIEHSMPNS